LSKQQQKKAPRPAAMPTAFDQARDELFSHILRCGVLEAAPEHQKEWMDDTMGYIADRYPDLSADDLGKVRVLGERFCQPVVKRVATEEPVVETTEAEVEVEVEAPVAEEATA
jgi:hypothetical protein